MQSIKKRCIFSIYIEIEKEYWDLKNKFYTGDTLSKSERSWNSFSKYKDRLIDNQKKYANKIGADYYCFNDDDDFKNFKKHILSFSDKISLYDVINFYKFDRIEYLLKQYDEVLFLDLDVICNTDINFFEQFDLDSEIPISLSRKEDLEITIEQALRGDFDFRSPFGKKSTAYYLCVENLCNHPSLEDTPCYNTAVMAHSKNTFKKLDYFGDFGNIIDSMESFLEDETMPIKIRQTLGRDNEALFVYKVIANNIKIHNLDSKWHFILYDEKDFEEDYNFGHCISKRFDFYFKNE